MRVRDDIGREIEALTRLDLDGLRQIWRSRYGEAPKLRSASFLRLMLAWRMQAETHGGLDRRTRRMLLRSGRVQVEGLDLGVGARLRREWQGKTIEITVEEDGFHWRGSHLS